MKVGTDHKLETEITCPYCGEILDGAFAVDADVHPSAGDISICVKCGNVMAFADDLGSLRELTAEEIREVAGDKRIIEAQNALAVLRTTLSNVEKKT